MSPVFAFTAMRWAHGGAWQGRLVSGFQKRAFTVPRPSGLKRRYATWSPSAVLSMRPIPPTSRELTNTYAVDGSIATPPKFGPPCCPGNRIRNSLVLYGVYGPRL